MATFIPGKPTAKRRRAAMQAALSVARENRGDKHADQVAHNQHPVASTPSPHVMDGTKGNGQN